MTEKYNFTKSMNKKTVWLHYNNERKRVVSRGELTNFWRCVIIYSKGDKAPSLIREETGITNLGTIRRTKYWLRDAGLLTKIYNPTDDLKKLAAEFIKLNDEYEMPYYMKPL